jgi:site-specific DNA recombinase
MSRPKAVIYTRVSTDKQAEEGTSLEVQEAACLRKAQELGAEVVDIQTDEGISGAFYISRPGIQRALKQIEAGQANMLITMKLDRSGRDADVLGLIRKRVVNAGAQLVFVDGANFENNATGNLMFRVSAGFAEYEREVIRERTTGGRRKRAEGGVQPCRAFSPYGYHIVNKQDVSRGDFPLEELGKYKIVEDQAVWVRAIFERYRGGASFRQVRKWLASEGVLSPEGCGEWSINTLRRILSHPVYMGKPVFGRTQRKVDEGRLGQGLIRTDYSVARDKDTWIYLACDPIVTEELWQACQGRMEVNKERRGSPRQKYLLTRLMFCSTCKRRMAGMTAGKKRYYRCPHDRGCPYLNINVGKMDRAYILTILELIRRPEMIETAIRAYDRVVAQKVVDTAGLDTLQSELQALERKESVTIRAQVDALMQGRSTEAYDRLLTEIDMQRQALKKRLASMEAAQGAAMEPRTAAEKVRLMLEAVEGILTAEEVSDGEKNGYLQIVTRGIYPDPETKQFNAFLNPILGPVSNGTQILIRVPFTLHMNESPCVELAEWPNGVIHCTLPVAA